MLEVKAGRELIPLKNWERLATSKIHCRPESYSHFASVKLVGFEKLKILTI